MKLTKEQIDYLKLLLKREEKVQSLLEPTDESKILDSIVELFNEDLASQLRVSR